MAHESGPYLAHEDQLASFIIPNNQGIKRVSVCVTSDYEFLGEMDLVFNPSSRSFVRFINRIPLFCDDSFKAQTPDGFDQFVASWNIFRVTDALADPPEQWVESFTSLPER